MSASGERRTSSRLAGRAAPSVPAKAPAPAPTSAKTAKAKDKREAASAPATEKEETPSASKKAKVDVEDGPANDKPSAKASATLQVGDALPQLTLKDEQGAEVDVHALRSTVIFTYPKANTGGCTKQACLYRDEYEEWKKAGFEVLGLSNDGPTSLKNWKEKQNFQYHLLSDPKRDLVGALTGSKSSTPRSHFVIDKDGKVALSSVGVKPADSSPHALKFVHGLK